MEYAPYYSLDYPVRVEVYDGFHFVNKELIPRLMWMTSRIDIGGVAVRTLNLEATLFCLLMSIYENANTVYGKLDGAASLRDYLDLLMLCERHNRSLDLNIFRELVRQNDTVGEVRRVLDDVCRVFESFDIPRKLSPLLQSCPSGVVRIGLDPSFDESLARKEAFGFVRNQCKGKRESRRCVEREDCGQKTSFVPYGNRYGLNIGYMLAKSPEGIHCLWRLPACVWEDLNTLGLQMAVIPSFDCGYLEFLVGVTFEDARNPYAFGITSDRLAQRLTPSRSRYVFDVEIRKSNFIFVEITVPFADLGIRYNDIRKGTGVIPNVYALCANGIYHQVNSSEEEFEKPVASC